jgi:hypothetical protein
MRLEITTEPRNLRRRIRGWGELPDSLYRKAARATIRTFIEENKRLRRDPRRQSYGLTVVLANALHLWVRDRRQR